MKGLDKALRRAGHQVTIAKDLPTLTKALQDRAVDIVLVDNAHVVEAGGVAERDRRQALGAAGLEVGGELPQDAR